MSKPKKTMATVIGAKAWDVWSPNMKSECFMTWNNLTSLHVMEDKFNKSCKRGKWHFVIHFDSEKVAASRKLAEYIRSVGIINKLERADQAFANRTKEIWAAIDGGTAIPSYEGFEPFELTTSDDDGEDGDEE